MTREQRDVWNQWSDPRKMLAEYDDAIGTEPNDPRLRRVRALPEPWRMLIYAAADGASGEMIARKFGLSKSTAIRRIKRAKAFILATEAKYARKLKHWQDLLNY